MTIPELGRLEEVCLRRAWPHEALNFTPWLAEHLESLSSVIGVPLELEGQEVAVEQFSADILARNQMDDSRVLIENQLEQSDHSHMGQIMTYLAGLEVNTVIWIASSFKEAHLSAIRWLNDHTVEPFAFFAVKLKVVRIADSPLAPVFEVVVQPNSWERQLQAVAKEKLSLSSIGQFRRAFWTHYLEKYPDEEKYGIPGGVSNRWRLVPECDLVISSYVMKRGVGLFVRGRMGAVSQDVHDKLEPHAEYLSRITGQEFGNSDAAYYFGDSYKSDASDESNWDKMADWLYQTSLKYENALREMGQQHAT